MTEKTYLWENFQQHPPAIQSQILSELESMLPHLTAKEQAETFRGAPVEVTLKYLGDLEWDAQVKIWREYLPAIGRKPAHKLLKREARRRLGMLRNENHCLA